jgi:hypothetical protein
VTLKAIKDVVTSRVAAMLIGLFTGQKVSLPVAVPEVAADGWAGWVVCSAVVATSARAL